MDQQLCYLACSALGELGVWGELVSLLVSVLALGYAGLQRHRKAHSDRKLDELNAQNSALEAEIKVLSLRPPPILITPSSPAPSSPAPSEPAPSEPAD